MTEGRPPLLQPLSRRGFLLGGAGAVAAAGLAAYLPAQIRHVIDTARTEPFDISKVKHLVFMLQENRSFDHYFGAMPGVRGFSDPAAIVQANGRTVFHQPDPANPDGYLLPFHADASSTSAQSLPSLSHAWQHQHASWNSGAMDNFVRTHVAADTPSNGPYTMAYFTGDDIPFHWALASAFTICDNYHCSVMSSTYPNRWMWMTGTIDPNGVAGGPALDNTISMTAPFANWITMGEILQERGVSWKVYQTLKSATTSQPTTAAQLSSNIVASAHNMFMYHTTVQQADQSETFGLYQNACFGSTLFGSPDGTGLSGQTPGLASSGKTNPYTGQPFDFTTAFEEDCFNGTLPAVSWIIQDEKYTEHPNYTPAGGADYIAAKISAVAANPDLWNSTVFIISYDENDGLFDHVPPVTPPAGTPDEFVHLTSPGGTLGLGYPIGSGFRVPCFVVSPWTVGGHVASEKFDHTSCLRLIEEVFFHGEAVNPNLSAWRRRAFGNFTSAFQPGRPAATSPADPANPADPNFTHATNAANLAQQMANADLPKPPLPGAGQTPPAQPAGRQH